MPSFSLALWTAYSSLLWVRNFWSTQPKAEDEVVEIVRFRTLPNFSLTPALAGAQSRLRASAPVVDGVLLSAALWLLNPGSWVACQAAPAEKNTTQDGPYGAAQNIMRTRTGHQCYRGPVRNPREQTPRTEQASPAPSSLCFSI